MARDYKGESKKARISVRNRVNPVEGGAVGHSRKTAFEKAQEVNANKPDIKEGRAPTDLEYAVDYTKRGSAPARTGQTRYLNEPMLTQLRNAGKAR